jgi:branched-chain amino acid transport system permease protein
MMNNINRETKLPRTIAGFAIAAFILLPLVAGDQVTMNNLTLTGIWAIAVMGFTLIMRSGQVSLGQAAFMAVGGYATAVLTMKLGMPFWPSLLMSGIISGLIALAVGVLVLRIGGIYFSIITLALGEIIRILVQWWVPVTEGPKGIVTNGVPAISLGGFEINFLASPVPYYYLMLILVAVAGLVFWRFGKSRMGGTLSAIAANQTLAEHVGIHLMKFRVMAFTLAGVFTGIAGGFYAEYLSVMTPVSFGVWQSIQILMMAIIGGISSLSAGPIVGALLLYSLGVAFSHVTIYGIQEFLFGAIVVLVILFLPKGVGVIDLWSKLWEKIFRSRHSLDATTKQGGE